MREQTDFEREMILNEIRVMTALDHPNIVRIYEFFEDSSYFYLVMELCTGGQLFDRLQEFRQFPENQAKRIFLSILEAVNYMQSNHVVH